jgi:hypothetical protein
MEHPHGHLPARPPSPAAGRAVAGGADADVALTRDDLRYLMRQYADAPRSPREAALHYGYPAASLLCMVLVSVGVERDWPTFVIYAWVAVMMLLGVARRAHVPRWRRERFAFHCPACRENLVPGRADLAMASGRCPACGHELFPG